MSKWKENYLATSSISVDLYLITVVYKSSKKKKKNSAITSLINVSRKKKKRNLVIMSSTVPEHDGPIGRSPIQSNGRLKSELGRNQNVEEEKRITK